MLLLGKTLTDPVDISAVPIVVIALFFYDREKNKLTPFFLFRF